MAASKATRRSAPSTGGVGPRSPPRGHCHPKPQPIPQPQPSDRTFSHFLKLPIELRSQIWKLATETRPRIIQIYYEPNAKKWEACSDGRGGLPNAILGTSQEARSEAIRGYTDVFGTLVDLEKDTIFISDPMFCLTRQRNLLLEMECMRLVKNAAFTTEMFHGLADSQRRYPRLNDSPAKILRRLDALEHFSLVFSEDGLSIEEAFEENDEELMGFEDSDNEGDEPDGGPSNIEGDTQALSPHAIRDDEGARDAEDEEAFEQMSKRGYFRQTGNIRFESAYRSVDYGDDFEIIRRWFLLALRSEKRLHMDWKRPKVSIVEVKYGLSQIGDFHRCLHSNGDYSGGILEHTFEAESSDSESNVDDSEDGTSDDDHF